jgi:trans-AT polyketide synthase/acyltransferase/oxidoreductase domain-containing protein
MSSETSYGPIEITAALRRIREALYVVRRASDQAMGLRFSAAPIQGEEIAGALPPLYPEWLGDRTFQEAHGVRFPYCVGPMANGIASAPLVIAAARSGVLAFFGAAGLSPSSVETNLNTIKAALTKGEPWGSNLIHSPNEPRLEETVVDLYLKHEITRVDASAFMDITPAVVRYAVKGLKLRADGAVERRNRVLAKISRPEVARRFLEPPPESLLAELLARGGITSAEANLGRRIPLAEDITVESDSGGHTDNRPLGSLFPTIAALRDEIATSRGYKTPIRIGAAGGLGTPASLASAFALGASYVMTGTVNEAAVESGLSESGRQLLAQAGIADVAMAPAADMFEMGVKVQVLRRGTMFATRAQKLYDAYMSHDSIESLPEGLRTRLESEIFKAPLETIWADTRSFWEARDPREVERAQKDPHHRMALCFRWYLGKASRWANAGEPTRIMDYQIWCGPAMGAFNTWAKGSFLNEPKNREVGQIALNFLEGAAVIARAQQVRTFGVPVPPAAFEFRPVRMA